MRRDIEVTKVNNFLLYLIVGLVPLAIFPIDGTLQSAWTKLVLLWGISVVFIFLVLKRRDKIIFMEDTIENRFLGGYFILVFISLFFSLNPMTSLVGSVYRHDGFLAFIAYVFAYLIARNVKQVQKNFFPIVTVTSVLVAIYGILQFYKLDPVPAELYAFEWVGKAFSTMGNPNFLGSYLVLSIPMPVYLYFNKGKKLGLIAYSILFLALLTTRTRGAWIGTFIALIAFIVLYYFRSGIRKTEIKKILIVFFASITMILFFILTSGSEFFTRFFSVFNELSTIVKQEESAYLSGSTRVYVWEKVVELIKMRPFFGFGLDTMYIALEANFRGQIIGDLGRYVNWDKAHNEYLNIAVSSGIPSLLAYLGFLFFALKKGIKKMKFHKAYVPLLAAIIGYLVQAMFNIQVVMVYYLFFAYLGILTSKEAFGEEKKIDLNPETTYYKHPA